VSPNPFGFDAILYIIKLSTISSDSVCVPFNKIFFYFFLTNISLLLLNNKSRVLARNNVTNYIIPVGICKWLQMLAEHSVPHSTCAHLHNAKLYKHANGVCNIRYRTVALVQNNANASSSEQRMTSQSFVS
jgi:hypothetical protein